MQPAITRYVNKIVVCYCDNFVVNFLSEIVLVVERKFQ